MMDDSMPIVGEYRGVGIHAFQSTERIEKIVKPEIDRVFAMSDVDELFAFLRSCAHAPEARLAAGARLKAISEQAADKRIPRPTIPLETIDAWLAGLDSVNWTSPDHYASDLEPDHRAAAPRPAKFAKELEDCRAQLAAEERKARADQGRSIAQTV